MIEVDIEKKDDYLYVAYTGEYRGKIETLQFNSLLDACGKHSCSKMMVDITGCSLNVSGIDRYEYAKEVAKFFGISSKVKIACIVKPDQYNDFAEIVARNRGADYKAFTDKTEGMNWLHQRD